MTRPTRTAADPIKIAYVQTLSASAQAQYAAQLLDEARTPDGVRAALAILTVQPPADFRTRLLAKYQQGERNGGKRDPGGLIRIQLLKALHPLATTEDIPLLERAATTYEYLFGEEAGDLRAAALLTLNIVDDQLVDYYCVRLLHDEYTSRMSGEPALTATRILASHQQYVPLYDYVFRRRMTVADVVAECLRSLVTLPPSLLAPLVEHYRTSEDDIVLLGLFDLLLNHEAKASYTAEIFTFLHDTTLYNIYRYLITALVASRDSAIIARLTTLAQLEHNPTKAAILHESLALI